MTDKEQNDGASIVSDSKPGQIDKPAPSLTEKMAMVFVTLGIAMTVIPFAVKFMTGIPSMSDAMAMIAILGAVVLIIGAILAIVSRSKTARRS